MQIRGIDLDEANLKDYENLDGVPSVLVRSAIFANSEEEVEAMAKAHVGERQGMMANLQAFPTVAGEWEITKILISEFT